VFKILNCSVYTVCVWRTVCTKSQSAKKIGLAPRAEKNHVSDLREKNSGSTHISEIFSGPRLTHCLPYLGTHVTANRSLHDDRLPCKSSMPLHRRDSSTISTSWQQHREQTIPMVSTSRRTSSLYPLAPPHHRCHILFAYEPRDTVSASECWSRYVVKTLHTILVYEMHGEKIKLTKMLDVW
jgi:hypothetical protein